MSLAETDVSARVINDILNALPQHVRDAYRSALNKSWLAIHDKRGVSVKYTEEEVEACTVFEAALTEKKEHRRGFRPRRLRPIMR